MHIQIVLFDGFDLLDALAPYEIFVAANLFSNQKLNVELVTAQGPRPVPCGITGLEVSASGTLDPEGSRIIVVPGAAGEVLGNGPGSVPAILARAANTQLVPLLRTAMDQADTIVATVCGGSVILAMAGLLEARHAVTHHLGTEVLVAAGAISTSARVVHDGNLITGGGVTSGLDVALYIVEQELGPQIANAVEGLCEYERRGTPWRANGLASLGHEPQRMACDVSPEVSNEDLQPTAGHSSVFDGMWDVTISTPIGKQKVIFQISTRSGIVSGTASQGDDVVEFIDPVMSGNRLTWSQRVTKPMSLQLKFDLTVHGDSISGTAKAGLLPSSRVEGIRIPTPSGVGDPC